MARHEGERPSHPVSAYVKQVYGSLWIEFDYEIVGDRIFLPGLNPDSAQRDVNGTFLWEVSRTDDEGGAGPCSCGSTSRLTSTTKAKSCLVFPTSPPPTGDSETPTGQE